jgi:hypothetical protein
MHALQCAKCHTRDQLQEMRIQESPPQEQREESLIFQAL